MLAVIAVGAAMLAYVPFGLAVLFIDKKLFQRADTKRKRRMAGGLIITISIIGIIVGILTFRGIMADYL
ncbi:hypothetical protein M3210_07495 [Oceanobacillus luteolus]|uniref:DUF4190 domain-containing protein n=1 Tax=Oceanobacillus luteolus TaxID=1274358 RepID=A0ABW4HMA3_9BACI|nr:hypothetical protein [Oceanobacillus luteolus]MCM3740111.1 hypothetical protein [Oceanobacillus luteolus]